MDLLPLPNPLWLLLRHVQGLMDVGLLGPFNKIVNAPGHAETDFQKWLDFRGDAAAKRNTYSIQPRHEKFEPW